MPKSALPPVPFSADLFSADQVHCAGFAKVPEAECFKTGQFGKVPNAPVGQRRWFRLRTRSNHNAKIGS